MIHIYTNQTAHGNEYLEIARLFLPREPVRCFELTAFTAEDLPVDTVTVDVSPGDGVIRTVCRYYYAGQPVAAHEHIKDQTACNPTDKLRYKRFLKRGSKNALFELMRKVYPKAPIPWGSLTGIRPTRLLRELLEAQSEEQARQRLETDFFVQPQKAALLFSVLRTQQPIFERHDGDMVDIYCGIPFCATRCLYCSFASYPMGRYAGLVEPYLQALYREMAGAAEIIKRQKLRVRAIYLGGGTPTALHETDFEPLINKLRHYFEGAEEFTVEAGRPDTITWQKLAAMRRHGVTRISINPQSMVPETLMYIGRGHTPEQIVEAFALAREAGFGHINADIIMGLPGEGLQQAKRTLKAMQALGPDSLTVHTLAVKRASELHEHLQKHPLPDAETVMRMVDLAATYAHSMGLSPYYLYRQKSMAGNLENVGYARPGCECLYNVDIMEERVGVLALGAGAISKRVFNLGELIRRQPNSKDLAHYIEHVDRHIQRKKELFE